MELSITDINILNKYEFKNWARNLNQPDKCDLQVIEKNTRTQSDNEWWHKLRDSRITASTGKTNNHVYSNKSMKYGLQQESIIHQSCHIIAYLKNIFEMILKQRVKWYTNVGLFISEYGYYCASPDGLIITETNDKYVVEIKNPSSYQNVDQADIIRQYSDKKRDVCVKYTGLKFNVQNKSFYINKKHEHWRQIQRQIYSTGAQGGLYVVGFNNAANFLVVKVLKDVEFCAELCKNELSTIEKIRNKNKYIKYCNYMYEYVRLSTFNHTFIDAEILAFLGFYHEHGIVKCIFCKYETNQTCLHDIIQSHMKIYCIVNHNKICTTSNVPCFNEKHKLYVSFNKRWSTYGFSNEQKQKATNGLFKDNNNDVCFVCGFISTDIDNHFTDCKYKLYFDYKHLLI
uniref:Alk-exo n=1 Tax=Nesodiprion zhejiangensis nucleopolyhedrovirus TaxID=3135970 RepID=A0AAN0LHK8_9BACU